MRVIAWIVVAALAISPRLLTAQAAAPESLGSVVGHVYLAGSNLPGRFASVALQPMDMKPPTPIGTGENAKMPVKVVQTALDGGYRLDQVPPGNYYVVVTLPGYLSPIAQFTQAQLTHPTPEIQQKITESIPTVTIRPNSFATADVRLTRGASISGLVQFDDGSPATAGHLNLLNRDDSGRWQDMQKFRNVLIDEEGRFHIYGLSPGEYMLRLSVDVVEAKQSAAFGWVTNSSSTTKYSLLIYSGDTTVEADAKVLTLTDGQALNAQDITIPVSKLHSLIGSVIDARTGQALNAGRVSLVNGDGKTAASASIDAETRTFNFAFAPEGEYKLRINDARESRTEPLPAEARPGTRPRETVLRAYSAGEVALILHSDTSGVTIPVQLKSETDRVAR